ncbi:MAG: STAS domain-containing protein [Ignavibacteriales bacterium]|jgi:anti-sigma B factor antagonist|nr:STAS domain-containing protein [Ignavibacteriales bacterium]
MEINITKTDGTQEIFLSGRLDITWQEPLEKTVEEVFDENPKKVILNCEELTFISSAGLRVFMKAHKLSATTGIELYIAKLNETTKKIFDITGYLSIFNLID